MQLSGQGRTRGAGRGHGPFQPSPLTEFFVKKKKIVLLTITFHALGYEDTIIQSLLEVVPSDSFFKEKY